MANNNEYPEEFLKLLRSVTSKRPRTVIEHLLKHGTITTAELEDLYGYKHPPRAIRDVREYGIPVDMKMIVVDGRRMSQYSFGDPSKANPTAKKSGRLAFTRPIKEALLAKYGSYDFIYYEPARPEELQIDHRIPYEIGGDGDESEGIDRYMLLTGSANRLKSHSCENCKNWKVKNPDFCRTCFWAYPEDYSHVAGRAERVIPIVLDTAKDIALWDELRKDKGEQGARRHLLRMIREMLSS